MAETAEPPGRSEVDETKEAKPDTPDPTTAQSLLSATAQEFTPGAHSSSPGDVATYTTESVEPEVHLRGGYYDNSLGWWVPYYTGELKSYNMRSGYGFIHSVQTQSIYKSDVFIHKSQMIMPWKVGQPLEFAVTINGRGQAQAVDVMWLPADMPLPAAINGAATDVVIEAGQKQPGGRPEQQKKARLMGTLKSFSPGQGYGFIASEDIFEQHTRDAYLDRSQLPPAGEWRIGQPVEFESGFNGRGHPQVREVNWDPVTHLPKDENNPAGAGSKATVPVLELQSLRTLNRLLAYIREGELSTAVRMAVDLQEEKALAVNYVSFVLDRLGPAKTCSGELTGIVSMLLLIKLTQMLSGQKFDETHMVQSLCWCEAILPTLQSKQVDGMSDQLKFSNVIGLVRENLEAAFRASMDPAFEPALALLRAMP